MTLASEAEAQPAGTFWLLHLNKPVPDGPLPSVAAAFQRVGPEAASALAQAMGLDAAPVLERLARGRRCYIARVAGVLAAYGWVSFDAESIGELGLRLHLAPGEAYIWNCATLPAYRGQRLYPALLGYIVRELHSEGLRRVWIGADSDNLASQKGMILAGFQPVADIFMPADPIIGQPWIQRRPDAPEHLAREVLQMLFDAKNQG